MTADIEDPKSDEIKNKVFEKQNSRPPVSCKPNLGPGKKLTFFETPNPKRPNHMPSCRKNNFIKSWEKRNRSNKDKGPSSRLPNAHAHLDSPTCLLPSLLAQATGENMHNSRLMVHARKTTETPCQNEKVNPRE